MKQLTPPDVLVKTYIEWLKWASDDEAHIHAKRMLITDVEQTVIDNFDLAIAQ